MTDTGPDTGAPARDSGDASVRDPGDAPARDPGDASVARPAPTPWGTGLTVAAFVAAVIAAAIVVLSLGLTRVHPLLAVGLNLVAVGGLAPTVWEWRRRPVWRWFVLGSGVGVAVAWLALVGMALGALLA